MSDLAEPIGAKTGEEGLLSRTLAVPVGVNWMAVAITGLLVVAAGMRFWDLGSRALHHDESLHAWTAWKLFDGQGYEHQAWLHGPFQFFGTALTFFLFGVTDYTSRVFPAVFGTALVALPFFLRRRLGTAGALLAAAGIAFSPTLLYFSRFARNDIYIAFFTLGLVVLLWRYIDERKPQYLYLSGMLLGLAFATKESIFINAAVIIAFLNVWMAVHFWRQIEARHKPDALSSLALSAALLPFAWAVAALWPFAGRWRERIGLIDWHPAADLLIVFGTLTLPQFAAAVQVPLDTLFGVDSADLAAPAFGKSRENVLGAFTIIALVSASAAIGLRWNARVWALTALAFYVPYALLYTSFLTNLDGFYSGHWGALDYWLDQQDVARGNQPWFYYLMLLPAYEFLPLAFAAPALFYFAVRGDTFVRFLIFWGVATVFGYSLAGEKMPWVSVNTSLPFIILGAYALGRLLTAGAAGEATRRLEPLGRPLAAAALGLIAVGFGLLGPDGGGWVALRVVVALGALAGLAWLILPPLIERLNAPPPATRSRGRARRRSPEAATPSQQPVLLAASALAGALLAATLFVGGRLTYDLGDVPRELLVYTQTSPFVPDVVESVDAAGTNSTLGAQLPVVIDGGLEPWAWYLRDYERVTFSTIGEGYVPPDDGAVLILLASGEGAIQPYADRYQEPARFPLRWWFPEFDTYKTAPTAGTFKGIGLDTVPRFAAWFLPQLFRPAAWETWWDYFRYREPPGTTGDPVDRLGRLDMVAYFPKEYEVSVPVVREPPSTTPGATTATPPPLPPAQQLTVDGVIGGTGQPGGLALDAEGNVYVTEVVNHRVLKLDAAGNELAEAGGRGAGEGQFEEPWGVAVDAQGNVYVADTFNHRIQKFDSDLSFLLAWGGPASSLDNPEPDAFWGPRDVAVDANGDVWITDGGTGRVLKYTGDGQLISSFGGSGAVQGEFNEPTAIEISAQGDIYVADSGNRRVQRFDPLFGFVAEYLVPGWLEVNSVVKPYIALLPGGGFIVSDPTQDVLVRFDGEGTPVATLNAEGEPLNIPRGIASAGDGFLYVAEAGSNQLRRLILDAAAP